MSYRILVVNPGSTSTKIGVYEDEQLLFDKTLRHSAEEIAQFNTIPAQKDWRRDLVMKALREQGFDARTLSAVSGRGGLLRPIRGGTYAVNDNMVKDCTIGVQGQHASNLGGLIAREIGDELGIPSYIVDPVVIDEMTDVARYAGHLRARVKQQFATVGERRRFWEKLFVNDRLAQSLANDDRQAVADTTEQLLTEPLEHRGEVVLVGAGPGDAGLLTLKGLQQIQQADVVVYDRLVSDDIMNLVRRDADRVFVGKRSGYHCVPQEEINQILLREAQKGRRVVRLKGGDPFIFGRGGEELETLCEAGIPFSVVPGITAASGCSAYSGIPLTHRDFAQGVRLVTGHLKTGGELDWANLAVEKQTLVFYMGLNQAPAIREKLIAHGMAEDMPAAIVENGTAVTQKVVSGTLGQLDILAQQMASPALIIVGRVVGLRDKLNWFSNH